MFAYYLGLALRSLKRNGVLTVLMIMAIGVGIGACMTMLTLFRAMSGDPIPQKSTRLYTPQIDNWGPGKNAGGRDGDGAGRGQFQNQLSYIDAAALLRAHAAPRQAAMYSTALALTPADPKLLPLRVQVRATSADFFSLFDVPFRHGAGWSSADDEAHAEVAVITRGLNDKLFGGANSVGRTIRLDDRDYRVAGVLDAWEPVPRFYDLNRQYGGSEDVFLPFTRAVEEHMEVFGNVSCSDDPVEDGWKGRLHSECVWTQFWAELPGAADAARYRAFLDNYAAEQQRSGRFHWPARTQLLDVKQWLSYRHVVLNEVRMLLLVSFSFLIVCLLNAMGLMLAKIMGRTADLSVRRALGANRAAVFSQCLIEAGVVGLAGGLVGLGLTVLGLTGLRALLSPDVGRLTHLDVTEVGGAVLLGVMATVMAGLYPTWRAARVQPAWQLKAQ